MRVKEILVEQEITKQPIVIKNLEVDDSTEFEGFLRIKFLEGYKEFSADTIIFINRDKVLKIIPLLLK